MALTRLAVDEQLPIVLADLHCTTTVGQTVTLRFEPADPERIEDLLTGAGFLVEARRGATVTATRIRSLPDTVGPKMGLLVCGLNPSERAADAGVGFVRPGNRFWPAAIACGLVSRDRDPRHALDAHGVGMTDLVKRATRTARELVEPEYAAGLDRVTRLCAWLAPGAVCFVGLAGWRAAVDRRATAGRQDRALSGVPVYLMPSTSGLNASSRQADFVEHLGAAARLAGLSA